MDNKQESKQKPEPKVEVSKEELITRLSNVEAYCVCMEETNKFFDNKREFIRQFFMGMLEKIERHKILIFVNDDIAGIDILSTIEEDRQYRKLKGQTAGSFTTSQKLEQLRKKRKRGDDQTDEEIQQMKNIDKSRIEIFKKFNNGEFQILICGKHLSRGADFSQINVVIHLQLPRVHPYKGKNDESDQGQINCDELLHRIGRTGRAEDKGISILLCNTTKDRDTIVKLMREGYKINLTSIHSQDFTIQYEKIKEIEELLKPDQQEIQWEDLKMEQPMYGQLRKSLDDNNQGYPFKSQITAVPALVQSEEKQAIRFAFPNGQGKTMCFAIPMMLLYDPSLKTVTKVNDRDKWAPQFLVFSPTKEVCHQTAQNIRLIRPESLKNQFEVSEFFKGTDTLQTKGTVIVSTPGYYANQHKVLKLDNLKMVIFDEADQIILDKRESEEGLAIFQENFTKYGNKKVKIAFFSATYNDESKKEIKQYVKTLGYNLQEIENLYIK